MLPYAIYPTGVILHQEVCRFSCKKKTSVCRHLLLGYNDLNFNQVKTPKNDISGFGEFLKLCDCAALIKNMLMLIYSSISVYKTNENSKYNNKS